jgi:hypothetical protein
MVRLATGSIIAVFIILTSFFMLFAFEERLKDIYTGAIDKGACKSEVIAHSKLKLRYIDFSDDISCPTIPLKIDNHNENVVKRKIADSMYDCWDQYGRGQLELFTDENNYCAICHRISLDEDVKFSGLSEYLAQNNHPSQDISYLQFLTTEKTQNSEYIEEFENRNIINSVDASVNSEYAIVFTYIKGKKNLEEFTKKVAYTAPGVGLTAVGAGLIYYSPGVTAAVSATLTPAVGVPAGAAVLTLGTISLGIGALWSYLAATNTNIPFDHIALVSFIPYNAESLQSLNCRDLPVSG